MDSLDIWRASQQRRRPDEGMLCQNCVYWVVDNWTDERRLAKANMNGFWSDVRGFCKKHAPTPTSQLLHEIAQFAGEAAWALDEMAKIQTEDCKDYRVETKEIFYINEWPMTDANAWCGEFKAGRKLPTMEELEQVEAAWEAENEELGI
jgi:hypothetical protein